MTDVLKHGTDIFQIICRLLSEKQILNLPQWTILTIVDKVIPSTRVTIQHGRRLDDLSPVFLPTPLALERIVGVARCVVTILEELTERVKTEVALNVFCRVDNTRGE